ncbi:DUF4918 family protein [bacterium]|nr:DUF4918 family protein [bacterium]
MTLADKILQFNDTLALEATLPKGVRVMNPFKETGSELVNALCHQFYHKYYHDKQSRKLILGINPGRHGAGLTGIPFTDPKRLESHCQIAAGNLHSHEPSSVFVYEVIDAFGGAEKFYQRFFINSVCPLGFVMTNAKGSEVNCNYYDMPALQQSVTPFIKKSIEKMIEMGLETQVVFCWGTGKNYTFLKQLNQSEKYFDKVLPLEHPRYIMQYKSKLKEQYINKYLQAFAC